MNRFARAVLVSLFVLPAAACGDLKSKLSGLDSLVMKKESAETPPASVSPPAPPPSTAPAGSLAGVYEVRGTNPGGTGNYSGTAMISQQGDSYRIDWSVGTAYTGTGTRQGNTLSVEWGDGTTVVGTVKYNIESDGRLTGVWYMHNNPDLLGSEILLPRR